MSITSILKSFPSTVSETVQKLIQGGIAGTFSSSKPASSVDLKDYQSRFGAKESLSRTDADLARFRSSTPITPEMRKVLDGKATLKEGSRSESVGIVQDLLRDRGFKIDDQNGKLRGKFGPQTERALRQYQQDHGLKPDGILGQKTLRSLLDEQKKSPQTSTPSTPPAPPAVSSPPSSPATPPFIPAPAAGMTPVSNPVPPPLPPSSPTPTNNNSPVSSSSSATNTPTSDSIAYGQKVSPEFKTKVLEIAKELQMDPNDLMAVMAFESGGTFSPSVKNAAGSGATGLIQFMPSTAKSLGTTTEELSKMSATEQLDYVKKYLEPYKGKVHSIEDLYMTVLWPKGVGKSNDYVLFESGTTVYTQNKGLDLNKDGKITKEEAAAQVRKKLNEGKNSAG